MIDLDPFMEEDACVDRLMDEYHQYGKLIIALDFDDTIFDFHGKGRCYPRVEQIILDCQKLGFYIMLFTGGHPDGYPKQMEYLADRGIYPVCINENPIPLPFGNYRKPYYNVLLDDRAGLGQAYRILRRVVLKIEKEKSE